MGAVTAVSSSSLHAESVLQVKICKVLKKMAAST